MAAFIIRDARVFTGEETFEKGFVYVSDGKIKAAGSVDNIPSVSDIQVISKPGHTLLPGLIDAHIHADKGNPLALRQSFRFGVTTVCDMHNEAVNVRAMRALTKEPDTSGYKTAGISATIENGWPIPVITAHDKSPETLAEIATWPKLTNKQNVEEFLDATKKENNPDYIKLMHESGRSMGAQFTYPTEELQRTIVDAAHARGYLAVAHATSLEDTITVLRAGVDGLTHTLYDQPPTPELIQAYKKNNAWLNPTLTAMGSLTKEGQSLQEKYARDPRGNGLIGEAERERKCQCMAFTTPTSKVEYAYESVRQLRKAGIDIICGSDSAGPALGTAWGLTIHQELYLFVTQGGMTPEEALRSATSVTARRFRFSDRGRLAEGLKADLLLVEGNPLADIDATLNVRGVWRDGALCSVYEGKL